MITMMMVRPCSQSICFPPVSLLSLTNRDRVTVKLRYFSSPNLFSALFCFTCYRDICRHKVNLIFHFKRLVVEVYIDLLNVGY